MHLLQGMVPFKPVGNMKIAYDEFQEAAHNLLNIIQKNCPDNKYRNTSEDMLECAVHYATISMQRYMESHVSDGGKTPVAVQPGKPGK